MSTEKVTLVILDTYDPDGAAKVLTYCAGLLPWADVKLLTHRKPTIQHAGKYIQVPHLTYHASSTFYLRCLTYYIESEFALSIHRDGFILNPHLWREEFLNYDYIGAPWPASSNLPGRVGNGGFSLRSKRLLEATAAYPVDDVECKEDVFVCDTHRKAFEEMGLKFAPLELAASFSLEHPIAEVPFDESKCFGFHGWVAGRNPDKYMTLVETLP